jgi:hypothetical protein
MLHELNDSYKSKRISFELCRKSSSLNFYKRVGISSAETDSTGHITVFLTNKFKSMVGSKEFNHALKCILAHELEHRKQYKQKLVVVDDSDLSEINYYLDLLEIEAFAAEILMYCKINKINPKIQLGIFDRLDDIILFYRENKLTRTKSWKIFKQSIMNKLN